MTPADVALLVLLTAALSSVLTVLTLNLVDRPNDRPNLVDRLKLVDRP